MKPNPSLVISLAALVVSLAALVLALRPPPQAQIEAMVDARLAARERAMVEAYAPSMKAMLGEMSDAPPENWSPTTLRELLAPLVDLMTKLSTPPE